MCTSDLQAATAEILERFDILSAARDRALTEGRQIIRLSANTVRAGYTVIGYDVDAARVRDHVRAGGVAARNSADVRKRADIVICSLPSAAALARAGSTGWRR